MKKQLLILSVFILIFAFIVAGDFIASRDSNTNVYSWEQLPLVDPDESYIVYFYVDACRDCEKAEHFFQTLPETITIGTQVSAVRINKYNIFDGENLSLYMEMLTSYNVPEQEQSVPIVFLTNAYLSGYDNISNHLPSLLASGGGLSFTYPAQSAHDHQPITLTDLWGFFLAGLLGGLNPCSISLLFLLLSLLTTMKKNIIRAGMTFVAARFTAYLVIGLSIFTLAAGIDLSWLTTVTGVLNTILIIAAIVIAILNFVDCIHLLRKSNARILVQLPVRLRRFNQKTMEKFLTPKYAAFLLPIIFIIGLIISAGEFLCTGQIYLASILYTLQRGVGDQWVSLAVLLTYITAMCIPPTIFVIAISKGRSIMMLSDAMQERLWIIKLLNGALFTLFALLLIVLF